MGWSTAHRTLGRPLRLAGCSTPRPSCRRPRNARRRRSRAPRAAASPDGAHRDPLRHDAAGAWQDADRAEFARAWGTEIAALPEFTDSNLHIVTGLLLPIWKRLPNNSMRVYRLQTDDGERIIGRLVSPAWVAQATQVDAPTLDPADAHLRRVDCIARRGPAIIRKMIACRRGEGPFRCVGRGGINAPAPPRQRVVGATPRVVGATPRRRVVCAHIYRTSAATPALSRRRPRVALGPRRAPHLRRRLRALPDRL